MGKIYKEEIDLTHLEWTKTRHSSGTAGSFLKAYENIRGQKIYYKLSNYDVVNGIIGHECVNEIVVARLLEKMEIDHLDYDLINATVKIRENIYHTYLCRSYDFKQIGDSKIALDSYYDMWHEDGETPLQFCARNGWDDYIYKMLTIDYLIMNRDRHGANIEILKNRKSKNHRPAPLFDHGLSLLCSSTNDEEYKQVNPLIEKKVQCFIGSNNTLDNLNLIPRERLLELPAFDKSLKAALFHDMDGVMSNVWINSVWNFLTLRANQYENL